MKIKPVQPPVITSKDQLKAMLADFMPTADGTDATFVAKENGDKPTEFAVNPGTKSHNRKLLIDGFTLVRDRITYNKELDNGLNVDDMQFWVDDFIRDKLGGKRRGDKIVWAIGGAEVQFDPFTGALS